MMGKKMKVYLPSWTRWFLIPLFLMIFLLVSYLQFFTAEGLGEGGFLGWLLITVIMLGVAIMIWLMSSGRLPAYIIEEEENSKKK